MRRGEEAKRRRGEEGEEETWRRGEEEKRRSGEEGEAEKWRRGPSHGTPLGSQGSPPMGSHPTPSQSDSHPIQQIVHEWHRGLSWKKHDRLFPTLVS